MYLKIMYLKIMDLKNKERETMNWKKMKETMKEKIFVGMTMAAMVLALPVPAYAAGGIESSKFITGTVKMLNDGASGLTKLCIAGAIVAVIAFGLMKMFADDMEDKQWNKRLIRVIIGCIIGLTASLLVEMFTGYYA